MQAILDMFAFLNSAIDSGAMTQKAFSIAVLGLSGRIYTGWREGAIPSDRLPVFSRELEQLDGHWRAHREAAARPRLKCTQPRRPAPCRSRSSGRHPPT